MGRASDFLCIRRLLRSLLFVIGKRGNPLCHDLTRRLRSLHRVRLLVQDVVHVRRVDTLPFVSVVSRLTVVMSCVCCAPFVMLIVPALTALRVVEP